MKAFMATIAVLTPYSPAIEMYGTFTRPSLLRTVQTTMAIAVTVSAAACQDRDYGP